MRKKKRLLVVEAHSDDSAISIGGFLEKFRKEFDYHFLLVCASSLEFYHSGVLSREYRLEEYQSFVEYFDGFWHQNDSLPLDQESRLDTFSRSRLVSIIESIMLQIKPEVVISQGPSFHHDHTAVYEAVIAATRPTFSFHPHDIYIMENPTYVHSLGPQTDFRPNLYVQLSEEQVNRKIDINIKYFPSQIRKDSNYLSAEGIKNWARYRGIEARCDYAEALKVFKKVV